MFSFAYVPSLSPPLVFLVVLPFFLSFLYCRKREKKKKTGFLNLESVWAIKWVNKSVGMYAHTYIYTFLPYAMPLMIINSIHRKRLENLWNLRDPILFQLLFHLLFQTPSPQIVVLTNNVSYGPRHKPILTKILQLFDNIVQ